MSEINDDASDVKSFLSTPSKPIDILNDSGRPKSIDMIQKKFDRLGSTSMNNIVQEPNKLSEPTIDVVQKFNKLSIPDQNAAYASTSMDSSKLREVELFTKASELEGLGRVSDAIKLYKQAFRLNPDVERLVMSLDQNKVSNLETKTEIQTGLDVLPKPKFQAIIPKAYEEIEASIVDDYEPLDLPSELVKRILGWVGCSHVVSLEECAKSCKKLYLYSRSSSVWNRICQNTFASSIQTSENILQDEPFRIRYFEMPRIRTDGVYICKITYFRPGITDGAYYQPIHLVTYYRYLRFFSANVGYSVMLLVTTEEPTEVIKILKDSPETSLANFIPFNVKASDLILSFKDSQSSRTLNALKDATNKFKKTNLFIGKYCRSMPESPNYTLTLYDPQATHSSLFEMQINVASKKNNKVLNCDRYTSLSPPTRVGGSPSQYDFDTKDWNGFIFSRVRSYIS